MKKIIGRYDRIAKMRNEGATYAQIGVAFGFSKERAREIYLKWLRIQSRAMYPTVFESARIKV